MEEETNNNGTPPDNESKLLEERFLTLGDLIRIIKLAFIISISLILPSYLYFAGLQLGWAIALFVGFLTVAWLGYSIKK